MPNCRRQNAFHIFHHKKPRACFLNNSFEVTEQPTSLFIAQRFSLSNRAEALATRAACNKESFSHLQACRLQKLRRGHLLNWFVNDRKLWSVLLHCFASDGIEFQGHSGSESAARFLKPQI